LSITYNIVGLYISLVLDILIWISIIIETRFNKIVYLFYIINNIFFSSNEFISLSILYEFQTIPLLLLINLGYKLHMMKGVGITNILLVIYNLISGLLLYNSFYNIYFIHNIYLISHCHYPTSLNQFILIILCIIYSGFIKLSIFPFHMWLGFVHVEAPTVGSIILAGVSLKTGFCIHFYFINSFVFIAYTFIYIIVFMICIGIVFYSLNIYYQIDSKRWIALYSIIHMNLYYIILFIILTNITTFNNIVYIFIIIVVVYGMIGHSFISAGLFLIIGYIYDITNNKNLLTFHNNILSSSIYVLLFIILLANSSLPLTALFLYELFSFLLFSHFHIYLSLILLTFSCSNLLSSLYIFYKYLNIQFHYYCLDFLLLFLLLPILSICLIPYLISI
jgi:NADH-quinone oxidoreductase subunit M